MASSVVTTARMCSCTIRPSWATGIEPFRREMQSNLRSFKALKVLRPPTSRRTAAAKISDAKMAGRECPLPAVFIWKQAKVTVDSKTRGKKGSILHDCSLIQGPSGKGRAYDLADVKLSAQEVSNPKVTKPDGAPEIPREQHSTEGRSTRHDV